MNTPKERNRLYISKDNKEFIDDFDKKNIMGFHLLDNRYIFCFELAVGMNEQKNFANRVQFIRNETLETEDEALISAIYLNEAPTDNEFDRYSDFNDAIPVAENCVENGYQILKSIYEECNGDTELLELKLMNKLNELYLTNVKSDF